MLLYPVMGTSDCRLCGIEEMKRRGGIISDEELDSTMKATDRSQLCLLNDSVLAVLALFHQSAYNLLRISGVLNT